MQPGVPDLMVPALGPLYETALPWAEALLRAWTGFSWTRCSDAYGAEVCAVLGQL